MNPLSMTDQQDNATRAESNYDEVVAMVDELRTIAHRLMRRYQDLTVQPTELANDAYLKLVHADESETPQAREILLARCVVAMKNLLKDHLRKRHAQKRGGHVQRVPLDDWTRPLVNANVDEQEFLEVIEELQTLGQGPLYEIAFGKIILGLTINELAATLNSTTGNIESQLEIAKRHLKRRLRQQGDSDT